MGQVTIYLDNETENKLKKAARSSHLSVSKWVTSVAFELSAVPAIRVSYGPIGVPTASNFARIIAATSASLAANGNTVMRVMSDSNCFRRFCGLFDFAIPTSSSYRATDGMKISFGDLDSMVSATLPMPLKK